MSVAILFNPMSGRGRALKHAQRMKSGLQLDGVKAHLIATQSRDAKHWLDEELRGRRRSISVIVVCGGDGTVRLAAPSAARAGLPIWHVPCGTENLFARSFGMTRSESQFRRALHAMRIQRIDLANANHEPFVLMGSLGLDARIVHALASTRKGPISHFSYFRPALECVRTWKAPRLAWEFDGEREELGVGMVVVANGREYGARLNPSADALPHDGLLDAIFIPLRHGFDVIPWIPRLRWGLQKYSSVVRERRARAFRIWTSSPEVLQLDGEKAGMPEGQLVVDFGLARHALAVLLPA